MSKTEQIALVQVDEQTQIAAMEFAQSDIKKLNICCSQSAGNVG